MNNTVHSAESAAFIPGIGPCYVSEALKGRDILNLFDFECIDPDKYKESENAAVAVQNTSSCDFQH